MNAAISSSVVLASRLPDDLSVFGLILFSVQSFALFPMLRRRMQVRSPSGVPCPRSDMNPPSEQREASPDRPHRAHLRAFGRSHVPPIKHRSPHLRLLLYLRHVHCSGRARVGAALQEVRLASPVIRLRIQATDMPPAKSGAHGIRLCLKSIDGSRFRDRFAANPPIDRLQ